MLGILAMLNWGMAALYVSVLGLVWMLGGDRLPFEAFALIGMFLMLAALPSAYLGYAIEKGRGRILQTVFAVLALFNFPLGTAYGVFALWVCWSAEAEIFDQGGIEATQPQRDVRRRQAPIDDEVTVPKARGTSPYAIAQRLKQQGLKAGDIQEQLHVEGLSGEEIETLMNSLGVKFSRVKQRHLEEFSSDS